MNPLGRILDPQTVEKLNHLAFGARSVVEGNTAGLHRSPIKGASVEFREHRVYVPGDEPRHIDWRVLARSDKTFVKEYDEETNLRCMIFLDASGSMNYGRQQGVDGSKFVAAMRIVAAISYLMLAHTESAGLAIAREGDDTWLVPSSTSTQLSRLIDVLERLSPEGPTVLTDLIHRRADRLDRRSLVVIVSDFFSPMDAIKSALARLRYDRHEIVPVRMLHEDEESFPFKTWTRFAGLEGESQRTIEPAAIRQKYLQRFRTHTEELHRAARAVQADLIQCKSNAPLMESIGRVIQRR